MTATMTDASASLVAIWHAVNTLTHSTKVRIDRDDGSLSWAEVPSLWAQAVVALYGASEAGNGGASVQARARSVLDLDLMEVCALIRETVAHELAERHAEPVPMPDALRRLASVVTAQEPDQLWWWEYRFGSWARLLTTYLGTGEHQPSPVRLRNAACPKCDVRQVVIETPDGDQVVPALVIDFREGLVQAARCSACAAVWWRGAELEYLATLLR